MSNKKSHGDLARVVWKSCYRPSKELRTSALSDSSVMATPSHTQNTKIVLTFSGILKSCSLPTAGSAQITANQDGSTVRSAGFLEQHATDGTPPDA